MKSEAQVPYEETREADLRAARESGDWERYLDGARHEDAPLDLLDIAAEIESPEVYGRCVRSAWTRAEMPSSLEDEWLEIFDGVFDRRFYGPAMMIAEERVVLDELPDPVQVYRGFAHDGLERGFSWTTDRKKAEWFARRLAAAPNGEARVAVGQVLKTLVIAYLDQRKEREVLALPGEVSILRVEVV